MAVLLCEGNNIRPVGQSAALLLRHSACSRGVRQAILDIRLIAAAIAQDRDILMRATFLLRVDLVPGYLSPLGRSCIF